MDETDTSSVLQGALHSWAAACASELQGFECVPCKQGQGEPARGGADGRAWAWGASDAARRRPAHRRLRAEGGAEGELSESVT